MEDDKIRYSDIIEPDDAIEKLIKQLSELGTQYEVLVNAVRAGADRIAHALKSTSGATSEGRKNIDEATEAASRLERAYKELDFAISDVGKEVAWLKAQTVDANKATVEQRRALEYAAGSYDKLKAELKETVAWYKSLSDEERAASNYGQELLQDIIKLKARVKELDNQMKPHIETLSALQKAEKELAFLQSEEGKRYLQIKKQIREMTSDRSAEKVAVSAVAEAEEKLTYAQSEENRQLKLLTTQIREANKIAELQAVINSNKEGSYKRIAAQYALNKIQLNNMSLEMRKATTQGQELERQTKELYIQMIQLEEATGSHRLSVGNYARSWDRLGFSISQLTRELPSLAVSANTFFLGISNNVPMVIDEIAKLRIENKALAAQGLPTISITKSIVKSLFGWNTILVVLLTTLSMFGGEILDWIRSLGKGESAAMSLKDRLTALNEEIANGTGDYGKSVITVKKLKDEWSKLKTEAERTQWIKDNQSEFGKLGVSIQDVNDAENVFVKHTDAVLEAMQYRAKATAAEALAIKKYEEAFKQQAELDSKKELGPAKPNALSSTIQSSLVGAGNISTTGGPTYSIEDANKRAQQAFELDMSRREKRITKLNKEADAFYEMGKAARKAGDEVLENAGISLFDEEQTGGSRNRKPRDPSEAIYRAELKANKNYRDLLAKQETDSFAKRRAQLLAQYDNNIAAKTDEYRKLQKILENEENLYRDLTADEKAQILSTQKTINDTILQYEKQLQYDLAQLNQEEAIARKKSSAEALKLELETVREGSYTEYNLRLSLLKQEEELAIAENKMLEKAKQQDEKVIRASFKRQRDLLKGEYATLWIDEEQELQQARFDEVEHTEKEITRFTLKQEKERLLALIKLAENGFTDWGKTQIDIAKQTVINIDNELAKLDNVGEAIAERGLGEGLLYYLGFDDKQIDALGQAVDTIVGYLNEIMDSYVELAEKAVEAAEAQVEAAQSAYEAEIEARNKGFAHKATTAKKELEEERRNKEKQMRILQQAQQAQANLDTAAQASSLITAVANIWASFTKMGPAGYALAAIATAGMFGSFIAAKAQAMQAAAVTYGDGGYEFLTGGSHASGNDISIGTMPDGRARRAEGGETLAIFNKRQTRKYKKILPSIIDSINQGIFEDKFGGAFSSTSYPEYAISNTTSANTDLSEIEKSLGHIVNAQNGPKYYTLPDGSLVIIKGNIKRIIKKS